MLPISDAGRVACDRWIVAGLSLSATVAIVALIGLTRYEGRPGPAFEADAAWPTSSTLALDATCPSVFLFAHPRCPCTRASLVELRRVASDFDGRVAITVLFVEPGCTEPGWSRGAIRDLAVSIPGVRVLADRDGREARRFGACTSGHVVAYDANGTRLFEGGIAVARGHVGEGQSFEELERSLEGRVPSSGVHPVFGCELAGEPSTEE